VPEGQRAEVLDEARAAFQATDDDLSRSRALAALAPHFTEGELPEALATARAFWGRDRARALAALAPRLSEGQQRSVFAEALEAVRTFSHDRDVGGDELAALVEHLPDGLLPEALALAGGIPNDWARASALTRIARRRATRFPLPPVDDRVALLELQNCVRRLAAHGRPGLLTSLAALAPWSNVVVQAHALSDAVEAIHAVSRCWP
jgi:hypothetical protein